jgi:hypothetical protein
MNDLKKASSIERIIYPWMIFFIFLGLQSIPVLIQIISVASDPKNEIFAGLSFSRLLLLAGVFAMGLVFATAAWIAGRSESKIQSVFQSRWRNTGIFIWLVIIPLLGSIFAWGLQVYLRVGVDGADDPIYQRLRPVLFWVFTLGVQISLWLWIQRHGWHFSKLRLFYPVMKVSFWFFATLILLGILIYSTGYGIAPDIFFWGYPGVPLLSWQMAIALFSGLILLSTLITYPGLRENQNRLDWILTVGLLLLGAILWLYQPIPRSYFFPSPREPNFEIYPYSDAGYYDYSAQSLLIGEGYLNGTIVSRPLYVFLLAIFHIFAGQNYPLMISYQTIIFAFFPVVLYWIGRTMHSREAGLAAGILMIFREMNMIAATPLTEVSHSKMLMTESLTSLGIAVFSLVLIRWFRNKDPQPAKAVFAGGFLGLLILLRSQTVFFVPVALLLVVVNWKVKWQQIAKAAFLFIMGIGLVISPWLVRNHVRAGTPALDAPFLASIMAQRYSTSVEEANSLVIDANSGQVSSHIISFTLNHPGEVIHFIGAHFINNELAALSVLPLSFSFDDYHDNFSVSSLFWLDGVKNLSGWQWLLLGFNILMISIGLGVAWKRWRWGGLILLLFHLSYSMSSAVARISGWRFIQPVDWVPTFYFSLGFFEVAVWFFAVSNLLVRPREKSPAARTTTKNLTLRLWVTLGCALVVGLILPVSEMIIPRRFSSEAEMKAISAIRASGTTLDSRESINLFLTNPDAVKMIGRILYPRWYKQGGGEPGSGWQAYKAQEKAHLGFMMVGPMGEQQMILAAEKSPAKFPHEADAIVFGCQKDGYIDVRLVVGYTQPNLFAYQADGKSPTCE